MEAIERYLQEICKESLKRNYHFNSNKVNLLNQHPMMTLAKGNLILKKSI